MALGRCAQKQEEEAGETSETSCPNQTPAPEAAAGGADHVSDAPVLKDPLVSRRNPHTHARFSKAPHCEGLTDTGLPFILDLQIKNQMSFKEERKVGLVSRLTAKCELSQAPTTLLWAICAYGPMNSDPVHSTQSKKNQSIFTPENPRRYCEYT